ncbi:hypothetical protein [Sphaerisporangium dianthi]|uniref:Uncharacterized protein n=1 Tax=Sphaerisporangium dianthi TaxID=1436120 RepID=A0ABV9CV20_9ACTN
MRSVPGHREHHVAHAPAAGPAAVAKKIRARDGGEDGKKKCCKHCPPGPPGRPGRSEGISTALASPTGVVGIPAPLEYIGLAQGNGVALVRDPTSIGPANARWHDLSTIANYPSHVTDISLAAVPTTNVLHVTVRSATGFVRRTTCTLSVNVAWPGNCTAFTDVTPPL